MNQGFFLKYRHVHNPDYLNTWLPPLDLGNSEEIRSVSLGLLISSVVKLRSVSLLLVNTRFSDFFFTPFVLGLESPLVDFVCLDPRWWGCLKEELLPVEPN